MQLEQIDGGATPSESTVSPRWLRTIYGLLVGARGIGLLGSSLASGQEPLVWPAALGFTALSFLGSVRALLWVPASFTVLQALQVGRTIARAQLDVDETCELMYEWACKLADATIFHLGLFEGGGYTLKLWMREAEPVPSQTFRMQPGVGLVNWLRESKEPLLVRDSSHELDSLPAQPAYVSENPSRSALYVPIITGEKVIGTLSVQSYRKGRTGAWRCLVSGG